MPWANIKRFILIPITSMVTSPPHFSIQLSSPRPPPERTIQRQIPAALSGPVFGPVDSNVWEISRREALPLEFHLLLFGLTPLALKALEKLLDGDIPSGVPSDRDMLGRLDSGRDSIGTKYGEVGVRLLPGVLPLPTFSIVYRNGPAVLVHIASLMGKLPDDDASQLQAVRYLAANLFRNGDRHVVIHVSSILGLVGIDDPGNSNLSLWHDTIHVSVLPSLCTLIIGSGLRVLDTHQFLYLMCVDGHIRSVACLGSCPVCFSVI
ncbi:hypothetical protein GE21DRAFT_3860 [Neurospora crassa]|uniref:Uncharacterized protein n=1 Tax=Neurospora crassa (strain ATCC 24698 / 74-OR23-1A / CBS 708.71 / DSM 1257 / FGSC 987) TaxID=367110 RepID=Q7SAU2_NEUCR|nr:hypothetical protein NCU05657 [Neurospora crassa OR74A]EAA33509.1 hypothetical protein NCU05657 [Neurospora crassa OR74A]KHE78342.1 hypothetical protein GE21DRAFT_3860 [Neurospora crassa]|eukprot:XP_962745.1 hypothetical protein NCU05657 [Neurospora crassa OR74A]